MIDDFCPCSPSPMYHTPCTTVWSSLGLVELFPNLGWVMPVCLDLTPWGRNIEIFTVQYQSTLNSVMLTGLWSASDLRIPVASEDD